MLLTLSTHGPDANDLGYLLHKHPDRIHVRELGFGMARVVFPEFEPDRSTAALAVEVDAVGATRSAGNAVEAYVSDRPYVAGSLLSVALGRTFGSALAGRCPARPDRVGVARPLEATLSAVRAPGRDASIRRAFEPLGYEVECRSVPPEPDGTDPGVALVILRGTTSVRDLLRHLYILMPVVDGLKHYAVGAEEVDKLLRHGEGWLAGHPDRDAIVRRYLRFKTSLTRKALAALVVEDAERDEAGEAEEQALETPERLSDQRLAAVLGALRDPSAEVAQVVDLGCGEGRLLIELARDRRFEKVLGVDVSSEALDRAERRLDRERIPRARRETVGLIQGSLVYRDDRLRGFDAAVLMEVIEHVDVFRLPALERAVFGHAAPRRLVLTTPNAEYNALWPTLPAGTFRHRDHRFEWDRPTFAAWARRVSDAFGYAVRFQGIGPEDPERGTPTQMAIFDRVR